MCGPLVLRVRDDDVGVDIVEYERTTRHRVACVDRHVTSAELARGQQRSDLRRLVVEQRRERAGAAPGRAADGVRDPICLAIEFGVGQRCRGRDERKRLRVRLHHALETGGNRLIFNQPRKWRRSGVFCCPIMCSLGHRLLSMPIALPF